MCKGQEGLLCRGVGKTTLLRSPVQGFTQRPVMSCAVLFPCCVGKMIFN